MPAIEKGVPILLAPLGKSVHQVISLNFRQVSHKWPVGWHLVIEAGPTFIAKQLFADVDVDRIARMKYGLDFVLFLCITASSYKCAAPADAFRIKLCILIAYSALNQRSSQSASCRSRRSSQRSCNEPASCNDWPYARYGQRSQSGEEPCATTCYGTYRRASACARHFFVSVGRDHADF